MALKLAKLALFAYLLAAWQVECFAGEHSNRELLDQLKRSFLRKPDLAARAADFARLSAESDPDPLLLQLNHHSRDLCPEARKCQRTNSELDLLFLLDRSGSIMPCDIRRVLEFVESLMCRIDGESTRVGVVSFASHTRVDVPLCFYSNSCALVDQIRAIRWNGGSTATADALLRAISIFGESDSLLQKCSSGDSTDQPAAVPGQTALGSGDSEGLSGVGSEELHNPLPNLPPSKRVILITDGRSNSGQSPTFYADILRSRGVEVFTLGVAKSHSSRWSQRYAAELQSIASPDSCDSTCAAAKTSKWTDSDPCPSGCERKHVFHLGQFEDFADLAQILANDPTSPGRCSECPIERLVVVDGAWSPWSPWTECGKPDLRTGECGRVQKRFQFRSRSCTSPAPSLCGQRCYGSSHAMRKCFDEFVKCPETPFCPPEKPASSCKANPCDVTSCPAFPSAECTPDYCGGCNAVFRVHGVPVNCQYKTRPCDKVHCSMGRVCEESDSGEVACCVPRPQYAQQISSQKSLQMLPQLTFTKRCVPARQ